MNKINTVYPTQIPQQSPLKQTFKRFSKRLDLQIKNTITVKKAEHIKQAKQLSEQLQRIKKRSNKYKRKIYEQEKEFQEKVQNLIQYDIKKYEDYQLFFQGHFEKLQEHIRELKRKNKLQKIKVQAKTEQLKALHKQNIITTLVSDEKPSKGLTTKESSVRLSYTISAKRIKTDSSLPQLQPSRNQRVRTLNSQYETSPLREKEKERAGSYMDPIGLVRETQKSQLHQLGKLLYWYKQQVDPNQNWFLKVLFNNRNYRKIQNYINTREIYRKTSNYR